MKIEQLNWNERCCLSRVRLLALEAQAAAGGEASPGQLRRALDPIGGEVIAAIVSGGASKSTVVSREEKPRKQRGRKARVMRP